MTTAPPKDQRPLVDVCRYDVMRRLRLCEGVARPTLTDEHLVRFTERLLDLDPNLRIEANRTVDIRVRGRHVASIHVETDDACPVVPVLDLTGVILILDHCQRTPPMHKADMERLLTVRALAGDVDGRRAGATSLGILAGTPWSDPTIAGSGPGWPANAPLPDASDLPRLHIVRVRNDTLHLEQCVVFDSPKRMEVDPMTMLRVMSESARRIETRSGRTAS